MKQVECWRWRYRDAKTGRLRRTHLELTAEEAAKYPNAERIQGSLVLRDRREEFADTTPGVFRQRVAIDACELDDSSPSTS